MQRWAVELHSTFLVPDSPLDIFGSGAQCNSSNSLIHAIDMVLAKPEREEALRDVFTKVRAFALDAAQLRLKELRDKLKANLGGTHRNQSFSLSHQFRARQRNPTRSFSQLAQVLCVTDCQHASL